MKNEKLIIEDRREPKNKSVTIKVTERDYKIIKDYCIKNKYKISTLLNLRIKELIKLIQELEN